MKKQLLTLIAAATGVACFAQITLGDAYTILSELPALKTETGASSEVVRNATVTNAKTASCSDYKGAQDLRSEFFYMVESLPMRDMLIGANNGREMTYIFAQPTSQGTYNVLVLEGDADNGNYTATYGQTSASGVNAIRDSKLTLCQGSLALGEGQAVDYELASNDE